MCTCFPAAEKGVDDCKNIANGARVISHDMRMMIMVVCSWTPGGSIHSLPPFTYVSHMWCAFHRYRALGIVTADKGPDAPVKRAQQAQRKFERQRLRAQVYDVNNTSRRQVQGPGQFQR